MRSRILRLGVLSVLLFLMPLFAGAPNDTTTPRPVHQGTDPLVGWLSVTGPADATESPYHVFPQYASLIKDKGWAGYIEAVVRPQIKWGCRRFVLWLPFGTVTDPYRFDQPLIANKWGCTWLTDTFARDWKSFLDAQAAKGQPIEVIYYQGGINLSPSIQSIKDPVAKRKRIADSAAYPLAAGMSLGMDADAIAPDGSAAAVFAQQQQAAGVKVYLEARPQNNTFAKTFPIITLEKWWNDSDPDLHSSMAKSGMVPTSQLAGEVIRFPQYPGPPTRWSPPTWQTSPAKAAIKAGFSAAVEVGSMIENNVSRASLVK